MSDQHAQHGQLSARRRRRLVPPVDARARAVIAVLLAAAPFLV